MFIKSLILCVVCVKFYWYYILGPNYYYITIIIIIYYLLHIEEVSYILDWWRRIMVECVILCVVGAELHLWWRHGWKIPFSNRGETQYFNANCDGMI